MNVMEEPVSTPARASAWRLWLTACLALICASMAPPAAAQELSAEVAEALRLAPDPARGRQAFEPCVACHRSSANGRSDGAIPRLSGQHASVIIKQVSDIRSGRRLNPEMKPYVEGAQMTPQALADIGAYLQALPISGSAGKGPGTALDRGKALFARDCTPCHGANGEGLAAGFFPMLAAQHYGYLLRELELIRDGKRGNSNPGMVELIKTYSEADRAAVADHVSRLPPPGR
jgi:cytochrome c553